MSAGRHLVAGRAAERADVLALIAKKRRAARAIAANSAASPETQDEATVAARQLTILMGDIEAELHLGEAATQAQLAGEPRA